MKRRIAAIGSISKITKAMKLVASARLRSAQEQLHVARAFATGVTAAWKEPEEKEVTAANKAGPNYLLVVMTGDRGLCGGFNMATIRAFRPRLRKTLTPTTTIMFYGDKGRGAMEREFGKYYTTAFTDLSRVKRLTFKQTAMVAEGLVQAKYDKGELYYNNFLNTLTMKPTTVPLYPLETMLAATTITTKYENEGDDALYANFYEYRTAARIYQYLSESYAGEVASRMTAMSSSSKNAEEMLVMISRQYNRQRQGKITAELIEIISGASAADEGNEQ